MRPSPLAHAAEIYAPFDARESGRLRQYVSDAEDLRASSFFRDRGWKLTLSWSAEEKTMTTELPYEGEEAVRAVVPLFRQLYTASEPTSYVQVLKLLSRHVKARESALQTEAIAALRELRRAQREILAADHARLSLNDEELTATVLLDLYLYGHYLHKDDEKAEKLAQWPLADLTRYVFFTTMLQLCNLYWVGRSVVRRVLAEPGLVTAPPPRWGDPGDTTDPPLEARNGTAT